MYILHLAQKNKKNYRRLLPVDRQTHSNVCSNSACCRLLVELELFTGLLASDDLGWPLSPQTTSIFAFFVAFHIFVVSRETSYLVHRLTVASPSRRTTNRPWKGRGYVTWHVLNFAGPIHISGMAEARALKFCIYKGKTYQVLPKGWQITHKRGVVLLTWPIFLYAQLWT